jgi:hypothetical protein
MTRIARILVSVVWFITMSNAAVAAAVATELPRYGVFVYSDECVQTNQSGELGGDRIILQRFPAGDMVIYQYGNGPAEGPFLAAKVKIDDKRSSIRFDVTDEWGNGPGDGAWGPETIEGTLSAKYLLVSLHGGAEKRRLPRVLGFPKPFPACN